MFTDRSGSGEIPEKAKNIALRYLGRRPYSRGELLDRLRQKGESGEDAELVLDWLEELGLVDDLEYAKTVVRHYSGKSYGKSKITAELFRRKVPRELWDEALEETPEPDDALDELLMKKLGGGKPDRDTLRRATDFLQRRGYSWNDISDAVSRYKEESEDWD